MKLALTSFDWIQITLMPSLILHIFPFFFFNEVVLAVFSDLIKSGGLEDAERLQITCDRWIVSPPMPN